MFSGLLCISAKFAGQGPSLNADLALGSFQLETQREAFFGFQSLPRKASELGLDDGECATI